MLALCVLLPLVGASLLVLWRSAPARPVAIATSLLPLLLLIWAWLRFDPDGPAFQLVLEVPWVPSLGMALRLGVDGIALAVATMSAVLFTAAIAYPVDTLGRPRAYYAWLLFLEAASLGLFLSLDLLLFYVFFDLSLVGMYFVIARWGHGDAQTSALKFFLYTLTGSLALLLAILGLYLAAAPHSFDMRVLIETQPLAGSELAASLVLLGFVIGFGIKTPLVPVHSWLPQAHVDAPGPGSTILAGVLLKMGTYGLIRIPYSMMSATFADYALVLAVVAVISILYGSLVALGQQDLKRRIAYTSINHMGYTVLGIAAAGALLGGDDEARGLALTGATVEMVAHGLITGSLFLIAGSFWERGADYRMSRYGGLAARAPLLTGLTTLAAFASLGLPGLAGFVAEVQIFAGTFAVYPWLAAIGLLGILITAALFLDMLNKLFFGALPSEWRAFPDLRPAEWAVLGLLLAAVVVIGVYPRFLLDLIEPSVALLPGAR